MHILTNAHIYTMDPRQPVLTSIALEDERIVAVGSREELAVLADSKTIWQDMCDQTILPGLIDSHMHLECYALGLQKVDCETPSLAGCLERVAQRAASTPSDSWILGHGWNQNLWEEGFGSIHDLEHIAPDRCVYLTAKSLHAGWASRRALQAAGINENTADPVGGIIQRDEDGSPTGILFENAMKLLEDRIPKPKPWEGEKAFDNAQRNLWKYGITSVHDFDRRPCFVALQSLHQAGRLKLRVVKSLHLEELDAAIQLGLRTGFGDDYLRIGSVKLFADGALGPQTAAMLQPYENNPANLGVLLLNSEVIYEYGQKATQNGLSLAVHAIGDRANHEALNGYAKIRQFETRENLPHLRHRIEHVQILDPQDIHRLAELNIIASVQPVHAPSDMYTADRFWGKRACLAYAFNTLLGSGAKLVFGSDSPVESPNPFLGLHAATTRTRINGKPSDTGWFPQQRLNLDEALQGFTRIAAYASGQEDKLGCLSPGYWADLIVLPKDPFKIHPADLYSIEPSATMVGGEWVWEK